MTKPFKSKKLALIAFVILGIGATVIYFQRTNAVTAAESYAEAKDKQASSPTVTESPTTETSLTSVSTTLPPPSVETNTTTLIESTRGRYATPVDVACDAVEVNYYTEMRQWGDVSLPYAADWPTNDPGRAVNCAPPTYFGAAIVASHALFLDAFKPEEIGAFAAPGNQAAFNRYELHQLVLDPTNAVSHNHIVADDGSNMFCFVDGWRPSFEGWTPEVGIPPVPGDRAVVLVFTRCDPEGRAGSVLQTEVTMKWVDNMWRVLYPSNSQFNAATAVGLLDDGRANQWYKFENSNFHGTEVEYDDDANATSGTGS